MHAPALTPVDVSSIKALIKPYVDACIKRDWDKLLDMATDDIAVLPPDEPMISGSRKVRTWLEAYPAIRQFDVEFDHIEGQDQLAVAYGHFSQTLEAKGKSTTLNGKFVNTYRRDDHGKWLCAFQIWNSNAPAATR